jgi:hypothetical protein
MSNAAWEASEYGHERREKRHLGLIIILVLFIVTTNIGWLVYESNDVDSIYIESHDGGNASYIGKDGNIYNGTDFAPESVP